MADPAVRRPGPDALNIALSHLSVFTHNAPKAFSKPLAELYKNQWAEVTRGGGEGARGGEGPQHVRFEHRMDLVRRLPPLMGMKHVGVVEKEGESLVEDEAVVAGITVAAAGVAAIGIGAFVRALRHH